MTDPITPPPELVDKWVNQSPHIDPEGYIATHAAQWGADQQLRLDAEQIEKAYQAGADQELEACCEWLVRNYNYPEAGNPLRATRRPKPPSLKEEAMQALCRFMAGEGHDDCTEEEIEDDFKTIRRALDALPDD